MTSLLSSLAPYNLDLNSTNSGSLMESTSASPLEELLTVTLDEDLSKEYSLAFYPTGTVRKGSPISRKHFAYLYSYLEEASAFINSIQSILTNLYVNGAYFLDSGTSRKELLKALENLSQPSNNNKESTAAVDAMLSASTGRSHIIVPSTRYKNGFDIQLSGIPGASFGGTNLVYDSTTMPKQIVALKDRNATLISSDICKKVVFPAAQAILDLLFATPKFNVAAHERKVAQVALKELPLKAIAEKVDAITSSYGLGKLVTRKVPIFDKAFTEGLGKYFNLLIVKEPNGSAVTEKLKDSTAESEFEPLVVNVLQPEISFSISVSLPEDLCTYITQTPKGKAIPLSNLNTWFTAWSGAALKPPRARSEKGMPKVFLRNVPRYVQSPSKIGDLTQRRKKLGLYAEEGRCNEDGIFISEKGRFHFCPKAGKTSNENAKNFEAAQEKVLALSFEAGSPLVSSQIGSTSDFFALKSPAYRDNIRKLKASVALYGGTFQGYDWDYNTILTSSKSSPSNLISTTLSGTTKPDDLALTEYLTMPAAFSMSRMYPTLALKTDSALKTPSKLSDLEGFTFFENIRDTYTSLLYAGKVSDLQGLVAKAAKALGLSSLDMVTTDADLEEKLGYEVGLYTGDNRGSVPVLKANLSVTDTYKFDRKSIVFDYVPGENSSEQKALSVRAVLDVQFEGVRKLLEAACKDALGGPRSNLSRMSDKSGIPIVDNPRFFDFQSSPLKDLSNTYLYLGGRVFFELLSEIRALGPEQFMVVDPKNPAKLPPYFSILSEVLPFATFGSKYIPNSAEIVERGTQISENLKPDTSIGPEDIKVPGSKKGFQMFPHQVEANQVLRRNPKFATLDISPGGGKTILLLADCGTLMHQGLVKRPALICPKGLIKNYIEDLHSVTEGKWNIIPLTTDVYKFWGEERLTAMFTKAPPNTLYVLAMSFLKCYPYSVVIGNHSEKVSQALEFVKRFGFDYIAVDESHKAKRTTSQVHKAIKQLCVSSSVKFVRIATGTLIHTRLTDVVGQSALFGAHIFRTAAEYVDENSIPSGNGRTLVLRADTPARARAQLAKHSAVISKKKKEWAFMLPRPIETFIPVKLDNSDPAKGIVDEAGKAHQEMYDMCLKIALAEISKDAGIMSLLSGKDEDDVEGDESEGDGEDSGGEESDEEQSVASKGKLKGGLPIGEDNIDGADAEALESKLATYLARLEQLMTDPLGDPFGEVYFKHLKHTNYVPSKVKKVIERIRRNFLEYPWEKGKAYTLKSIVDYKGTRYCLMGEKGKKLTLESYTEASTYQSILEPDRDPRWKPEPFGKVIVFCRYNRSVTAIYNALPPDLKAIATTFSGQTKGDKWANLEAFRTAPYSKTKGPQILIANEQAISEGHNLQIASRIIRVENPWSPGELDQSGSRIFRPDTSSKNPRENIYFDWIVTDGTLEVAKLGRLISRIVDKTKFDEADNPAYTPLQSLDLPPISMGIETISATPNLNDILEYVSAYQTFATIQATEFEELRQTKPSVMFSIPQTEMMKGSAIMPFVPYIPGTKFVPDRQGLGLVKLTSWLEEDEPEQKKILKNKDLLIGKFVHTEMGNGVIVSVRGTNTSSETGIGKISSVRVKLAAGDEDYSADPAMIYLAQNVTASNIKLFSPKMKWSTKEDAKKAKVIEAIEEKKDKRVSKKARLEEARLARLARKKAGIKIPEVKKNRKEKVVDEDDVTKPEISLFAVVYNGFLAVEASLDDASDVPPKTMSRLGFKDFGDYAYIQIRDKPSFEAILDFLNTKFYVKPDTIRRIEALEDTFLSGKGRKFDVELAPVSEFRNFYRISHQQASKKNGKPELKIYPVIINGALVLNVDISTNPIIRRYIGKPIRGSKTKFAEAEGLWINFFDSIKEAKTWASNLHDTDFVVENMDEFEEELDSLTDKLKLMKRLAK